MKNLNISKVHAETLIRRDVIPNTISLNNSQSKPLVNYKLASDTRIVTELTHYKGVG